MEMIHEPKFQCAATCFLAHAPKFEFHHFDGNDVRTRVSMCQIFFQLCPLHEVQKVAFASMIWIVQRPLFCCTFRTISTNLLARFCFLSHLEVLKDLTRWCHCRIHQTHANVDHKGVPRAPWGSSISCVGTTMWCHRCFFCLEIYQWYEGWNQVRSVDVWTSFSWPSLEFSSTTTSLIWDF